MQSSSTQTGVGVEWTRFCNRGSDADRRMSMARDVSVSDPRHLVVHVHVLNDIELEYFSVPSEKAESARHGDMCLLRAHRLEWPEHMVGLGGLAQALPLHGRHEYVIAVHIRAKGSLAGMQGECTASNRQMLQLQPKNCSNKQAASYLLRPRYITLHRSEIKSCRHPRSA